MRLLAGDYDADGDVDAADYVVWRKTDGSPAGYNLPADGNGNGIVDARRLCDAGGKCGRTGASGRRAIPARRILDDNDSPSLRRGGLNHEVAKAT